MTVIFLFSPYWLSSFWGNRAKYNKVKIGYIFDKNISLGVTRFYNFNRIMARLA